MPFEAGSLPHLPGSVCLSVSVLLPNLLFFSCYPPPQKPSSSASDKSFAVGTVAEAIQGLGKASSTFVPRLMPLMLGAARDTDKEVRSNAIFGLGVLAEHGGEAVHEYPSLGDFSGCNKRGWGLLHSHKT